MSILEVSGLRKVYTSRLGGSRVEALRNVSFTVEQGEYVAIMGVINQTHEYRYHDTAVVEVFVFLHFFHHYDFTVGRSYHDFLRFLSEQTDGAAEEVHEYAIYYEADDRYYVKRNFAFQSEVKGSVDSQNQNQAACQCMCSFTVYAYLF